MNILLCSYIFCPLRDDLNQHQCILSTLMRVCLHLCRFRKYTKETVPLLERQSGSFLFECGCQREHAWY
uniref:Uncharacterized protein n=1 Tax=Anguilla anguilla TaxID=7936 RepID=A0A0E9WJF7_ANGAN